MSTPAPEYRPGDRVTYRAEPPADRSEPGPFEPLHGTVESVDEHAVRVKYDGHGSVGIIGNERVHRLSREDS